MAVNGSGGIEVTPQQGYAAINNDRLSPADKVEAERSTPEGQASIHGIGGGDTTGWDAPRLILARNEEAFGKGNAWIRFGKDRPSHVLSGNGGAGVSHCAAVDIVAGYSAWLATKKNPKTGKNVYVDPNFEIDAARVYLSQMSNPDKYFGLVKGNVGNTSKNRPVSTVALKADTIRIMARENIKLVTRMDAMSAQGAKMGNTFTGKYGIDLIACNDDRPGMVQPLVKGDNLVECLDKIIQLTETLVTILENFFEYDKKFKDAVQKHTHISPFYGTETAPDFKALITEGINHAICTTLNVDLPIALNFPLDLAEVRSDYLETKGVPGPKCILSRYNSTN